ncbi:hypothetical protein P0F65_11935 [Sphingomonas sp. I4]
MTSAAMDRASTRIFAPAGLDRTDVERALGRLAVGGADLGDLYFETRSSRNWRLEDGRVTAGASASTRVSARASLAERRSPSPIPQTCGPRRWRSCPTPFTRWAGPVAVTSPHPSR